MAARKHRGIALAAPCHEHCDQICGAKGSISLSAYSPPTARHRERREEGPGRGWGRARATDALVTSQTGQADTTPRRQAPAGRPAGAGASRSPHPTACVCARQSSGQLPGLGHSVGPADACLGAGTGARATEAPASIALSWRLRRPADATSKISPPPRAGPPRLHLSKRKRRAARQRGAGPSPFVELWVERERAQGIEPRIRMGLCAGAAPLSAKPSTGRAGQALPAARPAAAHS